MPSGPAGDDDPVSSEVPLSGGLVNAVVRVGDTVHRPTGPWTPTIHALLRHLEAAGFHAAPRVLGIDESGREILSYIEGQVAQTPWPAEQRTDAGLAEMVGLLRAYHDAVAGYQPQNGVWRIGPAPVAAGEIVRHGDAGPWNVVWRGGHPVGLIDWDFAEPGPAILDLAYMAWYGLPLETEAVQREAGFQAPPDLAHRLRVLCEAYGGATPAEVLDAVEAYQASDLRRALDWGGAGQEPWATFLALGEDRVIEADAGWLREHRRELLR